MPRENAPADRIDTRVSRLLGIRYPIVQGGMVWVSGWRLAASVSQAGALGVIGAGSMTPDLLAEHIDKLRQATDRPFGVNVPLKYGPSADLIRVCVERGVPAVFTSAGSPRKHTEELHRAGAKVVHVVPSAALARKVEDAGCDMVVAEGVEAGGHNSPQEITSAVLWPMVADAVEIPVIAAGGISDGRGVAAAMALGAEGAQLGTRFALTEESSAHQRYKEAGLACPEGGARLYLRPVMPTRAVENDHVREMLEAERRGASPDELMELHGRGRSRRGIMEGDLSEGDLEAGLCAGAIGDLPSAGEIVERLVNELRATAASLRELGET